MYLYSPYLSDYIILIIKNKIKFPHNSAYLSINININIKINNIQSFRNIKYSINISIVPDSFQIFIILFQPSPTMQFIILKISFILIFFIIRHQLSDALFFIPIKFPVVVVNFGFLFPISMLLTTYELPNILISLFRIHECAMPLNLIICKVALVNWSILKLVPSLSLFFAAKEISFVCTFLCGLFPETMRFPVYPIALIFVLIDFIHISTVIRFFPISNKIISIRIHIHGSFVFPHSNIIHQSPKKSNKLIFMRIQKNRAYSIRHIILVLGLIDITEFIRLLFNLPYFTILI